MTKDIQAQIERLRSSKNLPGHVAIIMDGNGRWAKKRRLPRLAGHRAGREPVRMSVRTCAKIGINYLTLYTFSLENWHRPRTEVRGLMKFLEDVLKKEYLELDENGVRLRAIGRTDMLPPSTRDTLFETIEKLEDNDGLVLTLAISYGGRAEIIDGIKRAATRIAEGSLGIDDLTEDGFREFLYDPAVPDPDLLIRTSGELRVSNFLLWQMAYSEIYVTDVLWPDFKEQHLIDAIIDYQKRDRRYGLTS
jgi:undecaprenyl diphosphate synthase